MAIYTVRTFGDPVLRTPADEVRDFGPALGRLVDDMFTVLRRARGVGLAAPQIGVGLRVFVYDVEGRRGHVVNPELTVEDPTEVLAEEGCLSIPGEWYETPRAAAARVTGVDRAGRPVSVAGTGMLARCLQHECDHLDGRLYLDRLPAPLRRQALLDLK